MDEKPLSRAKGLKSKGFRGWGVSKNAMKIHMGFRFDPRFNKDFRRSPALLAVCDPQDAIK